MDGWNTTFLLGRPIFRGYVSFREGNCFLGFHPTQSKNIPVASSTGGQRELLEAFEAMAARLLRSNFDHSG